MVCRFKAAAVIMKMSQHWIKLNQFCKLQPQTAAKKNIVISAKYYEHIFVTVDYILQYRFPVVCDIGYSSR